MVTTEAPSGAFFFVGYNEQQTKEGRMPWYRKHYTCPCGAEWYDEWDCLCNDRCPRCNKEIEPDDHEELEE